MYDVALVSELPTEPQELRAEWTLGPRLRTASMYAAAAIGVSAVWACTIWCSTHVDADPALRTAALFAHLGSLIVGMGAVLTLDWLSLRWLFGGLTQADVVRLAGHSHVLIWGGLAGLCVSGALLSPDLTSLATQIKLGAVLVLALNGLGATALQHRLAAGPMTLGALILAGLVATISQTAWWTATAVGFLNHG